MNSIDIMKKTMKENYEKVLWIFQEKIEDIVGNNCNNCGLVFEYKSKIQLENVISVITFENIKKKIIVSLYFETEKKKKKILELDFKEKNAGELILKALFNENKEVVLSDLFVLDKIIIYHTHNDEIQKINEIKNTQKYKKLINFED